MRDKLQEILTAYGNYCVESVLLVPTDVSNRKINKAQAKEQILHLLDTFSSSAENGSLEAAIKKCGYGFRSLSLHSDGKWIAKSGAYTGRFLTSSKHSPLEAVLKLEAKLDVRKVIKEAK